MRIKLLKETLNTERYKVEEELCRCGWGIIYKAWDDWLKRHVAIKGILTNSDEGKIQEQIRRSLQREALALSRLEHPNFVRMYDVCLSEKLEPYVVMEYVEGRSLKKIIDDNVTGAETPSLRKRLSIFEQILGAIHYAHDNGVSHRNLQPSNILIDGKGQVKIFDFSLALLDGEHDITVPGEALGTSTCCAPELYEEEAGLDSADKPADIYSLGVILYEMVTGDEPEGELTVGSLENLPSPALKDVISRCLQKSKDDRPNISELCVSFKACLNCVLGCASLEETESGQVLYLAKGKSTVLGRGSCVYVDLKEVDPKNRISRSHGIITYDSKSGHYLYKDLGASNGSYLDGKKLQPNKSSELHDGDKLRLGKTEFIFKAHDPNERTCE